MTQPPPIPEYNRPTARGRIFSWLMLRVSAPLMWAALLILVLLALYFVYSLWFPDYRPPHEEVSFWALFGGWILAMGGFLAGGVLLFFGVVVAAAIGGVHQRRAKFTLGYLEQAMRLNLPLPRFLAAAARSESGPLRRNLTRLHASLSAGTSISRALQESVRGISPRAVALIAAAEHSGSVAPALERIVASQRAPTESQIERRAFLRFYPAFMSLFFATVAVYTWIVLIPKFREIFNDFGINPPRPMRAFIALFSWIGDDRGTLALVGLALAALWLVGRFMEHVLKFLGILKAHPYHRNALKDFIVWHIPVAHAWSRDHGLADALAVIADAARAGIPLPHAIHDAAELDLNYVLARQLQKTELALTRGIPLAEAARSAGLPALVCGMWASGQFSASMPETCDFLARHYANRFQRTLIFLQASVEPIFVLLMGCLVAFIALTIFTSLAHLISSVSPYGSIL